jgi:ATP-binding cassette, subfamily B, bacterial
MRREVLCAARDFIEHPIMLESNRKTAIRSQRVNIRLGPVEFLRRIFRLLWKSSRWWTVLTAVLFAVETAAALGTLYVLKQLIESLTRFAGAGSASLSTEPVLREVVLAGVCTFLFLAARSAAGLAREAQGFAVGDYIDQQIHKRAIAADLSFFESPRYFDTLRRARDAGNQRPAQASNNLLLLVKNGVMTVGIMVLMAAISWVLLPILLLALIPALLVRIHFARRVHDWRKRRTQMERRASYLDWLMTSDTYAKEVRLNHLGEQMMQSHAGLRRQIWNEQIRISRRRVFFDLAAASVATAVFFGVLAFLAERASSGANSVGDLVLFLLIFQRAQTAGQEMIQQISALYEDHLHLGLLFDFLEIRPDLTDPPRPVAAPVLLRRGLRLERVSFRYPGSDEYVLKDINIELRAGQIVAIAGANGSGKTTLIKLLCRLYDPVEGRITLDGEDVRHFTIEDYRRIFSVIFQDHARYAETVRENIRFGDIRLPHASPRIAEAAIMASAHPFIRELKNGYETKLTRMFDDGQELSAGQWQKIAIARALLPNSKVVILDEPSSALDSRSEFDLFAGLSRTLGDRAAVVITHRLSTIRHADYIYVLDRGTICQAGTHDELISRQGQYRDLFSQDKVSQDI